jgi:ribosomal protein S18 acetylase RimI-like enzyme
MIEILKACDDDIFFLAEVCRDSIELYENIVPGSFEKQAARFERDGLFNTYEISIIYCEDHQVGFVGSTSINKNITYLVALYLLKGYQRRGIGKKVLNMLTKTLYQSGKGEVVLLAHKNATWAIDFYRENRFDIVADEEDKIKAYANSCMNRFYLPNTLLMSKHLPNP